MSVYSEARDGERMWTPRQAEDFRKWLLKFLSRTPDARKQMMNVPEHLSNNPRVLNTWTKMFMLECGFKINK